MSHRRTNRNKSFAFSQEIPVSRAIVLLKSSDPSEIRTYSFNETDWTAFSLTDMLYRYRRSRCSRFIHSQIPGIAISHGFCLQNSVSLSSTSPFHPSTVRREHLNIWLKTRMVRFRCLNWKMVASLPNRMPCFSIWLKGRPICRKMLMSGRWCINGCSSSNIAMSPMSLCAVP